MSKKFEVLKAYGDHKEGDTVELDDADAKGLVGAGLIEELVQENDMEQIVENLRQDVTKTAKEAGVLAAKEVLKGLGSMKASGIVVGEPESTKDPKGGYKHAGEFAKSVMATCQGKGMDERLKAIQGGSTASGPDGGYLIPDEFLMEVQDHMIGAVDVLNRASMFDVDGNNLTIPEFDDYDKSAAANRHGGVRAYWTEEGGAITASNGDFGKIELKLKKQAVLVPVTDELLSDSGPALGQLITVKGGQALGDNFDDAAINGTGVGTPEGIANAAALVTIAKESGQTADTIVAENLAKMYAACPMSCRTNAVWLVNPECEGQLPALKIGDTPVYSMPGGFTDTPAGRIFGRPVISTDLCAKLGDLGDIYLADWTKYVGIQKASGIEAAQSIHLYFDTAQTAFRLIHRVDGRSGYTASITPKNANSGFAMSPFITLAARA